MSCFSLALLVLFACGARDGAPPPPKIGAIGGDVVAVVGTVVIERDLVAKVATAQNVEPRVALDALIEDALAAQGAKAKSLDLTPAVKLDLDRLRARWVADGIQARAVAVGPPNDEEVAKMTARRWQAFDAPAGIKVIHAVVLKKKGISEDAAVAKATQIAQAVAGSTNETEFADRAIAIPRDVFDIRIEPLPPFVPDGRVLEGNGAMDATFTAAAFALGPEHRLSGIVATSFGWHVILFLSRTPEKRVSLDERRVRFTEEAFFLRGKAEKESIVDSYRKGTSVTFDPAADALMTDAFARFR
ncbi:hypothetical protein BH09MYX1_BH09MYX1_64770 [soil metagenome]